MKYRAFLSYSRADSAIAKRLHSQLDAYKTPRGLLRADGSAPPSTLHPVFRDLTDLNTGGQLSDRLKETLSESEALIVLCSPAAAQSAWVDQEIREYISLGRTSRIFPVIVGGTPHSRDPLTECLPPSIRGLDILAADLRETTETGQRVGDGRDAARLKLIAGLLDVPLDALVQRERRRQQALTATLAGAALVFAIVAVFAVFSAWRAAESEKNARASLLRFFAERAWDRFNDGDSLAAARYAVAGAQLSPANAEHYRAVLAAILQGAGESIPLPGHAGRVDVVAANSAATLVASGGYDGLVRIWRVPDGELVAQIEAHRRPVTGLAFSSDGTVLASAGRDGDIRTWRVDSGAEIQAIHAHNGPVSALAVTPDRRSIVTAGWDGNVNVYSLSDSGALSRRASLSVGTQPIWTLALDRDGRRAAVGTENGSVHVFTVQGNEVTAFRADSAVIDIAFCDAENIVAITRDGITYGWSTSEGAQIFEGAVSETGYDFSTPLPSVDCDGDVIVAAQGPDVALFSYDSNEQHGTFVHDAVLTDVAITGPGMIATAAMDGAIRLWRTDIMTEEPESEFRGHAGAVRRLLLLNGNAAITSGDDGSARFWPALTPPDLLQLQPNSRVEGIAFSPAGEDIALMLGRDAIEIRSYDGAIRARIAVTTSRFAGMAWSGDGTRLALLQDRSVTLWDRSGEEMFAYESEQPLDQLTLSHDGEIALVRTEAGRVLRITRSGAEAEIEIGTMADGAWLAPDGRSFVASVGGQDPALWNVADATRIAELTSRDTVSAVAFSDDSAFVAIGGYDGEISIWRTVDGAHVATLSGHTLSVSDLQFSRDGALLASASRDLTAKIWDLRTRTVIASLEDREDGSFLYGVQLVPDNRRAVTITDDGTVTFWDVSEARALATWFADGSDLPSVSPDGRRIARFDNPVLIDSSTSVASLETLIQRACSRLLTPDSRRFTSAELRDDQLLNAEWRTRGPDVCAATSN